MKCFWYSSDLDILNFVCHTRLYLGILNKLKSLKIPACKIGPLSGIIFGLDHILLIILLKVQQDLERLHMKTTPYGRRPQNIKIEIWHQLLVETYS